MKNLLLVVLMTLFFIGCATKESVEINIPKENVDIGKEINNNIPIGEAIQKEEIGVFEPNDIVENEISVLEYKETVKIAFTYPSRLIGKYAKSSMNTMLGYFDYKKLNYDIKVFDSIDENEANIINAFERIKEAGFTKVIALYSPRAMNTIHALDISELDVYLPLTNKSDVEFANSNFVYGGISYQKQMEKLLQYSNIKNAMFYQESFLGKKLKAKYETIFPPARVVKEIKNKRNYFKGLVKDTRLDDTTLFLNTGIVKTSILLSQLRVYEIVPRVIMSTQLNYNPKLLSLTQKKDRENFVIANSIDVVDNALVDTISTYGSDISYNWVDYSTLVGINYLYDSNDSGLILTKIENNEVQYEPKLFKSTASGFIEIK